MAPPLTSSLITADLDKLPDDTTQSGPGVGEFDDLTRGCSDKTRRQFAHVLPRLRLENAPALALSLRQKPRHQTGIASISASPLSHPASATACKVRQPPFNGVYNLVYCLEFSDGVKWALKVSRRAHPDEWTETCARCLKSEASVMQLLKRETTIPVPDIYAVDLTFDNVLGCPFLIMEFIDSVSLEQYWDIKAPHPEKMNLHQRVQLLQDLATAVIQLAKFQFDECGVPTFDLDSEIVRIGPAILKDRISEDSNLAPPLLEAGPFKDGHSFLTWNVDRFVSQSNSQYDADSQILFHTFLSWMQESVATPERFVLTHRDFGPQNILVSPDGRLCGIIDWDMVAALPRYLSNGPNGAYPHWLTRDLDLWGGNPSEECDASATPGAEEETLHDMKTEASAEVKTRSEPLDSEEQDFFRAIWRLCLEDASEGLKSDSANHGQRSVGDILAVVPRTYEAGLRPVGIDGRLLAIAADYPHIKLNEMVDGIRDRLTRLRKEQPYLVHSPNLYKSMRSRDRSASGHTADLTETIANLPALDGGRMDYNGLASLSPKKMAGSEHSRLLSQLSSLIIESGHEPEPSSFTPSIASLDSEMIHGDLRDTNDLTVQTSPDVTSPATPFGHALANVPNNTPLVFQDLYEPFSMDGAALPNEMENAVAVAGIQQVKQDVDEYWTSDGLGMRIPHDSAMRDDLEILKPWFMYLYTGEMSGNLEGHLKE